MERSEKALRKLQSFLQFLAFLLLDYNFGVLRGEQPLRRAPRAIASSGHLFASFWVSKRKGGRALTVKTSMAAAWWRSAKAACERISAVLQGIHSPKGE